jgi:uncharacterized RDD family membrane protein YckC
MSRKAPSAGELAAEQEPRPNPASRAAQAAARVAARYKNVPSYSEMLAVEARAAVAAAEAASRAALEAQAAAESVLASIEAASVAEEAPRSVLHVVPAEPMQERPSVLSEKERDEFFTEPAFELTPEPVRAEVMLPAPVTDGQGFAIRWEPDMPALRRDPEVGRVTHASGYFDFANPDWRGPEEVSFQEPEIGVIEPAQPIYANLIEFPRELIAARKVRPRLAEGPLATAGQEAQLSIFEVDPAVVSTEPEVETVAVETAVSAWAEPEWSGIKLGAEPEEELHLVPEPVPQVQQEPALKLAPLSRRALSIAFDMGLIGAAFVTAAMVAATKTAVLPALRTVEIGSAIALLLVAAFYLALFFTLGKATPGMRYAQIGLCTFDGQIPTRAQRTTRLIAMLISVLPMGLGIMWAVFDDDHLTWHDRLSKTYLRRY